MAREVLVRRCFACHGANGVARKNISALDRERLIATRVVVMSGKVIAFDGNLAAPRIAKELMKRFQTVREGKDKKAPPAEFLGKASNKLL